MLKVLNYTFSLNLLWALFSAPGTLSSSNAQHPHQILTGRWLAEGSFRSQERGLLELDVGISRLLTDADQTAGEDESDSAPESE